MIKVEKEEVVKRGYNRIREEEWLRGKGVRKRIKSKQEESGINHS